MVNKENILSLVIVNSGMGSKVLDETKKIGVSGGTIFLGKGTVKDHILEFLGLDGVKKEIVLIVSEKRLEGLIYRTLTEKFHLDKPNHGIAFSTSLNKVIGLESSEKSTNETKTGGNNEMNEYEAIFTVVERGLGQEVIDVASSTGSRGATIINARGSGVHEEETFFSMRIEPEKEIVMIIIEKEKSDKVIKSIKDAMHIDEPGMGIMFVVEVNRTLGLFKGNN